MMPRFNELPEHSLLGLGFTCNLQQLHPKTGGLSVGFPVGCN